MKLKTKKITWKFPHRHTERANKLNWSIRPTDWHRHQTLRNYSKSSQILNAWNCSHELVWVFDSADSTQYTCKTLTDIPVHDVCALASQRSSTVHFDGGHCTMCSVHTLQRHGIVGVPTGYRTHRNGTRMEKARARQRFTRFFRFFCLSVFFYFHVLSLIFCFSCRLNTLCARFTAHIQIKSFWDSVYIDSSRVYTHRPLIITIRFVYFYSVVFLPNQSICTRCREYVPVWARTRLVCLLLILVGVFFSSLFFYFLTFRVCDIWSECNLCAGSNGIYLYDGRLVNINEFIIEGNWAME